MCLLNYAIYVFIMEPSVKKKLYLCSCMKPAVEHVHMCCCISRDQEHMLFKNV